MVKKRKRQGAPTPRKLDSDEEADRMADPNPSSRSFMLDEVDQYHENEQKILLQRAKKYATRRVDSDEEEVFGLDLSSEEEEEENDVLRQFKINVQKDEMESDLEEDEDDDDRMPEDTAWGHYKPAYYDADYVDKGGRVKSFDEEQTALREADEAKKLEVRMNEWTKDDGLDQALFAAPKKATENEAEKAPVPIVENIDSLSKRKKIELVKQRSPELWVLLEDLKDSLADTKERLLPLISLVESGVIADGPAATFLKTKYQLMINYFTNACFYVMLMAKQTPLNNHPIKIRLANYRKMIQELVVIDEVLQPEVDEILKCIGRGGDVEKVLLALGSSAQPKASPKKKMSILRKNKRKISPANEDDDDLEDENDEEDSSPKEKRVSFAADWKKRKGADAPVLTGGDAKRAAKKATQELVFDDDTDDSDEDDDEDTFVPPTPAKLSAVPSVKRAKVAEAPTLPAPEPTSAAELKAMADKIDQARKLAGEKWKAAMKSRAGTQGGPAIGETKEEEEEEEETPIEADQVEASGDKRPINFQIAKNKGLTPYHKKEERNPRVKYRNKYKKATSRRKGQVREVKREDKRYGGETSGIRAGTSRSVKIK